MTINKYKMLRAYDCTEILESGCILSGIHAHKAHSIFPADSRILCRRNGPISPYPSDIMCRGSKKIWWAWVIIAVFSVNHASGARSPPGQTSPLRGRQETLRLRDRSGHHQPRFCKTLMDGLLWRYNKLYQVWIPNQFCINKSLFWVLPSYTTSLSTPTSTYLKFNPCRHPWIVLRLSLK